MGACLISLLELGAESWRRRMRALILLVGRGKDHPLRLHLPPATSLNASPPPSGQASLAAKHWHALEFFLSAADPQAAYPQAGVDRLLSLAIMGGDERLVLRLLRSGLRPDAGGANSQASALRGPRPRCRRGWRCRCFGV